MTGNCHDAEDVSAPIVATVTPVPAADRVLNVDLGDHLDRAELALLGFLTRAEPSEGHIAAEDLIAANRLYRGTAKALGDENVVTVLDELERALIEIAAAPERALPMLEGVLRGSAAPRLKTRALFPVVQSERPEARQLLADVARGQASPELQERAIGYLVARGTPDTRALLSEIYAGSSDLNVKRQVVRAFTRAGDAESLVALARKETDPALKREMVEKLALMRNKVALDYLAELAR